MLPVRQSSWRLEKTKVKSHLLKEDVFEAPTQPGKAQSISFGNTYHEYEQRARRKSIHSLPESLISLYLFKSYC